MKLNIKPLLAAIFISLFTFNHDALAYTSESQNVCSLKFDPSSLSFNALSGGIDVQAATLTNTSTSAVIIDSILAANPFAILKDVPVGLDVKKTICKRGVILPVGRSCVLPVSFTASTTPLVNSMARVVYLNKFKMMNYCTLPLSGSTKGVLDNSFINGQVFPNTNFGYANDDLTVDSSNRVIFSGFGYDTMTPTYSDLAHSLLVRTLSNGKPDTTFGVNGVVNFKMPDGGFSSIIDTETVKDPRGDRILAVGAAQGYSLFYARFLPNGSLDPEFGNGNGFVKTNIYISHGTIPTKIVALTGGKFGIVTMNHFYDEGGSKDTIVITAIDSKGNILSTFGSSGYLKMPIPDYDNAWFNNAVALGDKIFVTGFLGKSMVSGSDYFIYSADTTTGKGTAGFGIDGVLNNKKDFGAYNGNMLNNIAVANDGKIYAMINLPYVYDPTNTAPNVGVIRFGANGVIDTTFGTNGTALSRLDLPEYLQGMYVKTLKIDDLGQIYAVYYNVFGSTAKYLVRYNAKGLVDKTYGNKGVLTFPGVVTIEPNIYSYKSFGMGISSDNKIIYRQEVTYYNTNSPGNVLNYLFKFSY